MKLEDVYPRKYATGEDLAGKLATLTITSVTMESMHPAPGQPAVTKPALHFHRATKAVILSRPLWVQIAAALGDDNTDTWPGQRIQLYPEPMQIAGKPRIAIRARPAPNGETTPPPALVENEEDEI